MMRLAHLGRWARASRARRYAAWGLVLLLLPWVGLGLAAYLTPLPAALVASDARTTVVVLDRDGRQLREVSVGRGAAENPVTLPELSPWVVPALVAAEDSRFFRHPGVDPLAMTRAFGQLLWARRVISGASTLTQQLARTLVPVRRTPAGKLREMALALRLEASLSKSEVLEQYLSRVEFGPNLRGIEAASRHYFGKSATTLDLAEAAALVSIPRGPALYDPRRRPQLLERRRLRVLARMADLGSITPQQLARAELTPIRVAAPLRAEGAEHLSLELSARYATEDGERTRTLRTTLQAGLQREAERIAEAALPALTEHEGGALSLVVLDNETNEVLAYVGSPDYFDRARGGANDGVAARRQPGSALKPFVYAAALEQLGYGPATLLPDLPKELVTAGGRFSPKNYDRHVRGPVLLRQALGSSLNLPALEVASRLGPPRLLEMLRRFGFLSLDQSAEHYGVGLALGDGEVTLLELASAYAALARGGELLPPRVVLSRSVRGGGERPFPSGTSRRVLSPSVAALLSDMLSDDAARAAGFGRDSVLNLPFPVAAKTGTSKGFRDNWAVGYTHEVTVAVWAGNFDGSPLREASGITVAGPVFHDVMLAAMRGRTPGPLYAAASLSQVAVCALSGQRPAVGCPHVRLERFVWGQEPRQACDMHVVVHVDAAGRETASRCSAATKVVERYPLEFRGWAEAARRPLLGQRVSPSCPPVVEKDVAPRLSFPQDGQRFAIDADGPARQELVLRAAASSRRVRFVIDERPSAELGPPFELPWRMQPGVHRVRVEAQGLRSPDVSFEVTDSTGLSAARPSEPALLRSPRTR